MANRIIMGAVINPGPDFFSRAGSVSSHQGRQKENSPSKTQSKTISKAQKDTKKKKTSSRSQRKSSQSAQKANSPVRGEMAGHWRRACPRRSVSGVPETPPLMKVIPQRDGRFLLEPLSPKKAAGPFSRNPSPPPQWSRFLPPERNYNRFEPWNFSELILTQARYYRDTPYSRGGSLANGSCHRLLRFRAIYLPGL